MREFKGPKHQRGFFAAFVSTIWSAVVATFTSASTYVAIGFNLLAAALTKRPDAESPRLDNLEYQGSTYDRVIPVVYGEARVVGNIFQANPLSFDYRRYKVGGILGIGGTRVTETFVNGTFKAGFAEGEKVIRRIWFNEDLVYDTDVDNEVILNKYPDNIFVMRGTEDQDLPTPELALGLEGTKPAYRGLCYVHVDDLPLEPYGQKIPAVNAVIDDPNPPLTAHETDHAGSTAMVGWRIVPSGPQNIDGSPIAAKITHLTRGAGTADDSKAIEIFDLRDNSRASTFIEPHNPNSQFTTASWTNFQSAVVNNFWHGDGENFYLAKSDGGGTGIFRYNMRTDYVEYEDIGWRPEAFECGRQFIWFGDRSTGPDSHIVHFGVANKTSIDTYKTNAPSFCITYGEVLTIDSEDRLYLLFAIPEIGRHRLISDMTGASDTIIYFSEDHDFEVGEQIWIYGITDGDYSDKNGQHTVKSIPGSNSIKIEEAEAANWTFSGGGTVFPTFQDRFEVRRYTPITVGDEIKLSYESWEVRGNPDWELDYLATGLIARWSEDQQALFVRTPVYASITSTTPTIMRLREDNDFAYVSSEAIFYSSALPLALGGDYNKQALAWNNYYGDSEIFLTADNDRDILGINLQSMSRSYPDETYPYGSSTTFDVTDSNINTPATPTSVEGVYFHPYYQWVIAHYYTTDNAYVIPIRRTQHAAVTLRAIVSNMCTRAGLISSDFTVSGIDASTKIHGMVVDQQQPLTTYVTFLSEIFQFYAVDKEWKLNFVDFNASAVATISAGDLRATKPGSNNSPYVVETFLQEEEIPQVVEVTYTERDADWMKNVLYAKRMDDAINSRDIKKVDLKMSVSTNMAAELAHKTLRRLWTERSEYEFNLPPKYLNLTPGDAVQITDANSAIHNLYLKEITNQADNVLACKGRSNSTTGYESPASTILATTTSAVTTQVPKGTAIMAEVFEIPALNDIDAEEITFYVVADPFDGDAFAGATLEQFVNNQWIERLVSFRDGTIGRTTGIGNDTVGVYRCQNPWQWDYENVINVFMLTGPGALTSKTEAQVYDGENWALIGDEIVGFQDVQDFGDGTYYLKTLLRGLRGTEYYCAFNRPMGERFILLGKQDIAAYTQPVSAVSSTYNFRIRSNDTSIEPVPFEVSTTGKTLYPWAPVHVSTEISGNNINFKWIRRDRINNGWQSLSDVENSEDNESYNLDIYDSTGGTLYRTISTNVASTDYTSAMRASDSTLAPGFTFFRTQVFQLSGDVGRGMQSIIHYVST